MADRVTNGQRRWVEYCEGLLEGLSSALLIVDGDRRIVYANAAAGSMFGVRGEILIGSAFDDARLFERRGRSMQTPEGAPLTRELHPFTSALRGKAVRAATVVVAGPEGRKELSVDALPLSSDSGTVAVALVMNDLTEQHARSSEMAWMQRELVRTRREVEEALGFSQTLNAVNDLVHSTLAFEEVLGLVLEASIRALGMEMGAVYLCVEGRWATSASYGTSQGGSGRDLDDAELRPLIRAAEELAPLSVQDISSDDRFADLPARHGIRSMLVAPLTMRGATLGAICFYNTYPTYFSYEQATFASNVASTLSLAHGNAALYEEERHIAETLQRALTVLPDDVHGVEFQHLYRSATEAAWVGGDFFDVFALRGDRVGILIGDVSGKGVEASALASFTSRLVKAHAQETASPAAVISRTNDLVYRVSGAEDFVTVFFGILAADGTLAYCSAGHPSAVVLPLSGEGSWLEVGSPMIGAWDELEFRDATTRLGDGDVLVLYTDGIVEATANGEFFGDERLIATLDALAGSPLEGMPDAIVREVTSFTGGRLRDDVAILCCRRA